MPSLSPPDASNCFTAQTIPELFGNDVLNPDVGGVAVAISNIVINLTLPILLRWGNESDVQTTITMLLIQIYPVILATATSVNTRNLSLFDAHFAIVATASPVSIYLAYSSFRDFIGLPSSLFSKLTHCKKAIRYLGLTLPIIWSAINILISFSPRAFRNSPENCQKMSFHEWIQYQTLSNFIGILDIMGQRDLWNDLEGRGGLGMLSLITMWVWAIYMVYHRYDIYDEMCFRYHEQKERQKELEGIICDFQPSGRAALHLLRRLVFLFCNLIYSSWFVVTTAHPWMIFAIITYLHWSWILGLQRGMIIERYQLSYGQIISLFSVLPPLMSVGRLLYDRRDEFSAFVNNLWPTFIRGLRFIFTKSPNFWVHYRANNEQRDRLPRRSTLFFFEQNWIIVTLVWAVATTADVFWIMGYVDAGSRPNPRTAVNEPHKAWKPYSISMYIYGYCLCYVNIWFWSMIYHGVGHDLPSPSFWPISALQNRFKTPSWLDSRRKDRFQRAVRVVLAPMVVITCTGPLFAPFAALPLAQQWEWTHFCDSFAGEVELQGITNPLQTPLAHFYYPAAGNADLGRTLQYEYALIGNYTEARSTQDFVYNGPFNIDPAASTQIPRVSAVRYNLADYTFSAYCQHENLTVPCATGNYTTYPYLSFTIRPTDTGEVTRLRAQDKEWEFSNDAPSFILKFEDSGGHLGEVDMQSAVTKRSHCEILKVCLSAGAPDLATLVPLGIVLMTQDVYSQYCLLPRLYTV